MGKPPGNGAVADEDLMLALCAGDEAAFEELFRRYEAPLVGFLVRMLGDRQAAKDELAEVFMRVWSHRQEYAYPAKFTTWLYTIARNRCLDRLKRAERGRTVSLDALSEAAGATAGRATLERARVLPPCMPPRSSH